MFNSFSPIADKNRRDNISAVRILIVGFVDGDVILGGSTKVKPIYIFYL